MNACRFDSIFHSLMQQLFIEFKLYANTILGPGVTAIIDAGTYVLVGTDNEQGIMLPNLMGNFQATIYETSQSLQEILSSLGFWDSKGSRVRGATPQLPDFILGDPELSLQMFLPFLTQCQYADDPNAYFQPSPALLNSSLFNAPAYLTSLLGCLPDLRWIPKLNMTTKIALNFPP